MFVQKKHITTDDLGSEKIGKLLWRYSLPAIIATTASSLFNLTDSIFIGQGVGPLAVAGLGIVMPIMNIASAFGSMVGIGASALISIRLGQGNKMHAFSILGNVVLVNLILGLLISAVGLLFLDPILYWFGASSDVFENGVLVKEGTIGYARSYLRILLFGNVFTHLYLGLNDVLRSSGYPHKAMRVMLTAVLLNCVLDPLFIFALGWGIAGSAYATVIAQMAAFSIELIHFSDKRNFLYFQPSSFRLQPQIVARIFSIGAAPFLLHFCTSIVVFFVNDALKCHGGDLYIGAYSVINRVVMLFIMVVAGFNQGMQPIVGYNYGAKKNDRVVRTLKLTILWGVAATAIGSLAAELFPRQIASLFVNTDFSDAVRKAQSRELLGIIQEGLRIVFVVFPLTGFQIVTSNFFQYIGKSHKSILLSLTRQMIFLVPLLAILPAQFGYKGVWVSMPIADGMSAALAATLLYFQLRKLKIR